LAVELILTFGRDRNIEIVLFGRNEPERSDNRCDKRDTIIKP